MLVCGDDAANRAFRKPGARGSVEEFPVEIIEAEIIDAKEILGLRADRAGRGHRPGSGAGTVAAIARSMDLGAGEGPAGAE